MQKQNSMFENQLSTYSNSKREGSQRHLQMDSEINKYFDRRINDESGGSPKFKTKKFLGDGLHLFARDEESGDEPHSAMTKTKSMLSPSRRGMKSSGNAKRGKISGDSESQGSLE